MTAQDLLRPFLSVKQYAWFEHAAPTLVCITGMALLFIAFESFLAHGPFKKRLEALFQDNPKLDKEGVNSCVRTAVVDICGLGHVLIVVPLSIWTLMQPHMQADRLHHTSTPSTILLVVSSGYFLHDFIICMLHFDEWGPAYFMHGLLCTILYSYGLTTDVLHFYAAMFLSWELSTPFVYMRWFLYKMGRTDTQLYKYNGLLMVLVFFLCRTVAGTICSIDFFRTTGEELRHPSGSGLTPGWVWVYRSACLVLNCLNAFWLFKMVQGALKHLRGSSKSKAQ